VLHCHHRYHRCHQKHHRSVATMGVLSGELLTQLAEQQCQVWDPVSESPWVLPLALQKAFLSGTQLE
jgi:hypothetical protein